MSADNFILRMHRERLDIFKAQDPANSHFDVTFEVDGKKIYANKYVLETISTTFQSMLSERWKTKDEVIKLDTFSYDNFYQFLMFLYSGACALTDATVPTMTDMAEFYNVEAFKDFCDDYISRISYSIDNFFIFMDLTTKYTLPKAKAALDKFTIDGISKILESDKFMSLEKSSITTLVTAKRGPRQEEQLFEALYKWTEKQVTSEQGPTTRRKRKLPDNKEERIKAIMDEFFPDIKFNRMNPEFLYSFVVSKSFLFTPKEFSDMLYDYQKITVTVYDSNGKSLKGSFVEPCNIYDAIKTIASNKANRKSTNFWFCYTKPSKPSKLMKRDTVEFYFVIDYQSLKVKKHDNVTNADYLLCEMEGDSTFIFDPNCRIKVSRNCFSS